VEVILLDTIEGLGEKGATVKVAPGYARNFLIPQKLAISSGAKAARIYQEMARQREIASQKAMRAAETDAERFRGVTVEARARAGEDGTLFGSVTASDVAELLAAQGLEVEKRRIEIAEPIKAVGDYTAVVRLHPHVTAPIQIRVVTL
jgi:large subunit ribosomal protein L9